MDFNQRISRSAYWSSKWELWWVTVFNIRIAQTIPARLHCDYLPVSRDNEQHLSLVYDKNKGDWQGVTLYMHNPPGKVLVTIANPAMTYQMARVLPSWRKAAIFARYTNLPPKPFLQIKAQPTFVGLGYSDNYYLPEIVAFCLMFTYWDADVILKT